AFGSALPSAALASAALALPDLASPALPPALGLSSLTVSATAAANACFLSGRGLAVLRVPSAPDRPLNFCQSPVISSSLRTGSVGCAPTDSQYWARSESTSMREGSSLGGYLPISSIARPSRLVRAAATVIRYNG